MQEVHGAKVKSRDCCQLGSAVRLCCRPMHRSRCHCIAAPTRHAQNSPALACQRGDVSQLIILLDSNLAQNTPAGMTTTMGESSTHYCQLCAKRSHVSLFHNSKGTLKGFSPSFYAKRSAGCSPEKAERAAAACCTHYRFTS